MAYHFRHIVDNRALRILCGDSKEALKLVDSDSVDLVVTSPPYYQQRQYAGAGIGNEESVEMYLDQLLATFRQIVRVTKPTGNIVYNLGDKFIGGSLQLIPYQFALKAVNEFELRLVNDITWVKSNPTPHQFNRRLTVSKEPFFHFALSNKYYYDRDAFLPRKTQKRSRPTSKLGESYRELIKTSELDAEQKMAANKALDEVISEVISGKLHSFRMKIRGVHAPAYGGQAGGRKIRIDRDGFTIIRIHGKPMKRDIIETPVENLPGNAHPAIFPVRVVRELIRLLSPERGLVLDPYLGSGSTMVAAALEKRECIGIDISEEYCHSARDRVMQLLDNHKAPVNLELWTLM